MKPLCMDDPEYALWTEANLDKAIRPASRAKSPCYDCQTTYALEMRAESRCDGEPGVPKQTRFVSVEHLREAGRLRAARRRARLAAA